MLFKYKQITAAHNLGEHIIPFMCYST